MAELYDTVELSRLVVLGTKERRWTKPRPRKLLNLTVLLADHEFHGKVWTLSHHQYFYHYITFALVIQFVLTKGRNITDDTVLSDEAQLARIHGPKRPLKSGQSMVLVGELGGMKFMICLGSEFFNCAEMYCLTQDDSVHKLRRLFELGSIRTVLRHIADFLHRGRTWAGERYLGRFD